jgi:hypothetical protein
MFNPIKPVQPGRTIPSFPQRNAKIDQQPNHHEAYNLATRPITGNFLTVVCSHFLFRIEN